MRATAGRRAAAVITTAVLTVALGGFASPAAALPAGQWWYGKLEIAKANAINTGTGVTVAVLDSGVKASLPDLAGRVVPGTSYYAGGDGRTDLADGASYFGHGTAMAGFIAGTGKGAGMRGVAPGATLLPVRVGPSDRIPDANIAKGIRYAADKGAKVINMSLGTVGTCAPEVQQAVDYAVRKDVVLVASTGNNGLSRVDSPASCIGVIAVGGLAKSAGLVPYRLSNYGPQVDFVAPAEGLTSLFLNGTLSAADAQGTSIASAIVAGSFALLRSKYPDESARQIVTRALYNVSNKLGGKIFARRVDDRLGYGELLPRYGLTDAPPAGAKNPIYDAVEAHLKQTGGTASSGTPSSPSTPTGQPSSTPVAAERDGGLSGTAVTLLVVAGIALVAVVLGLVSRSRRRPRGPVPPGGYGPPPR